MNRLKGHLRLFAVVTALIVFAAAGAPAVFADTTPLDVSSGDIVIDEGGNYTITGTTTTNTITVSAGVTATITLENVDIDASATEDACAFLIESGADITLILTGENSLKSGEEFAGLQVPDGASLTIEGDGSLTAEGGYNGAGIGGYAGGKGGNITINGGTVTATGGESGAGIGGGDGDGAGIGGGNGGSITITGGTVTATGGICGAGIGGGYDGDGGTITINGGTVTATGGIYGAGIGGGALGNGGTITINDGMVTATGGVFGAGIGGGRQGDGGNVTISGMDTTVTATATEDESANDIGSGYDSSEGGTLSVDDGARLTLALSGTDATATLGNCTIDGDGAGDYARTYPPVNKPKSKSSSKSRDEEDVSTPVFFFNKDVGIGIDVSGLDLPEGVTLVSPDISGLPKSADGRTWALTLSLSGSGGSYHGRDYVRLYEFTLLDEDNNQISGRIGSVTLRIPVPEGASGDLRVLYYDEDADAFINMGATVQGNYLVFHTTHFSHYLVTGTAAQDRPAIPETGAGGVPYGPMAAVLMLSAAAAVLYKRRSRR